MSTGSEFPAWHSELKTVLTSPGLDVFEKETRSNLASLSFVIASRAKVNEK
jgi:hypothetical protein